MTVFPLFFLASTSLVVFADKLTVDPVVNAVQCQTTLLTWKDGVAPYNLSIYPSDDPSARSPALVDLGTESETSCIWTVTLPAGVVAYLRVSDSAGDTAQSSGFTVQLGSENNCLKATPTNSTSSTSAESTSGVNSGSVLTFSASATTGGSINDPQKASSTNTGDSSSPSSAAASHWHFTPVGTLAMTGVAVLFVVLVL